MKTRQTANRDKQSLTYKPPSEPESGGPNVSRTGVQEVELRLFTPEYNRSENIRSAIELEGVNVFTPGRSPRGENIHSQNALE